jgi:hypothetical protein
MQYKTKVVYIALDGRKRELEVAVGFYFATPRTFFLLDGLDVQAIRRQAGVGSKRFRRFPVAGPIDLPPEDAQEFEKRYAILSKQDDMSLMLGPWDEPSGRLVVPSYALPPAPYAKCLHPSDGEAYTRVALYLETEALYFLTTCYPGSPEWSPIHVILKPRYRAAAKAATEGYKPTYSVRLGARYASGSINPCFAPKRLIPGYVALTKWPVSDEGHSPVDVLSCVAKLVYDLQQCGDVVNSPVKTPDSATETPTMLQKTKEPPRPVSRGELDRQIRVAVMRIGMEQGQDKPDPDKVAKLNAELDRMLAMQEDS